MKKSIIKVSAFLMLAVIISLSACKREDADAQSAEDDAKGVNFMRETFALSSDANGNGKAFLTGFSEECYEINVYEGDQFYFKYQDNTWMVNVFNIATSADIEIVKKYTA